MTDGEPNDNGANGQGDLPKAIVLASKTLRGDIRDEILREFKGMEKPWAQMNEKEQERVIHRAADISDKIVNGALLIIAHRNHPFVVVRTDGYAVKDDISIKLTIAATSDNIFAMAKSGIGREAVLVFVEKSKFVGERKKAETDVVGDLAIPRRPAQGEVAATENAANMDKLEKTLKANNEAAAH